MSAVRYGMVVDTRKCVGCKACVLACKAENALPEGYSRSWIVEEVRGTFPNLTAEIRSERCQQCGDAACVQACPTGASYVGEGGVILVNRDKCTGCKACMAACSADARSIHPDGYADKCTLCMHRVQRGELPACVEVCPTNSLHFGDLNDPTSEVAMLLERRRSKTLDAAAADDVGLHFIY